MSVPPSLPEVTVGARSLFWFQAPLGLDAWRRGRSFRERQGLPGPPSGNIQESGGPRNPVYMKY